MVWCSSGLIRGLNLKIENIESAASVADQEGLIAWFADMANNIGDFFARVVHTDTLCVKRADGTERCITGDDLDQVIDAGVSGGYGYGNGGN
jgi:hypothetical protein